MVSEGPMASARTGRLSRVWITVLPATRVAALRHKGVSMYTFVRRGDAQKLEARAFAVEISRIVKKVTGLEVVLNAEQFGAANGIYWVIRGIESLDEFQKQIAVLLADPEYLAKVNEGVAGEYFVPGSLEDLLLQSVDV